jgi:death-on-curing protein
MLAHLDRNKLTLYNTTNDDLYAMILAVANHSIAPGKKKSRLFRYRPRTDDEIVALAKWIRARAQAVTRGELRLTYRDLDTRLQRYDYALKHPRGNSISVVRFEERLSGIVRPKTVIIERRIGSIPYPGPNQWVPVGVLKELREMCRLREEDGYDREAFYGQGPVVGEFINRYRTILRKLARK